MTTVDSRATQPGVLQIGVHDDKAIARAVFARGDGQLVTEVAGEIDDADTGIGALQGDEPRE